VISDSCHSGTVARIVLYDQLNELTEKNDAARTVSGKTRAMPIAQALETANRDRPMYDTVQYLAGNNARSSVKASLLLISGCQDNQLSYDGDENTVGEPNSAFEQQRPFSVAPPAGTSSPSHAQDSNIPNAGGGATDADSRPTLRRGDTGDDVWELQEILQELGYSVTPDGHFGSRTARAVKRFQRSNGMPRDGIVGPATWQALFDQADHLDAEPHQPSAPTDHQGGGMQPTPVDPVPSATACSAHAPNPW